MKKIIFSAALISIFTLYAGYERRAQAIASLYILPTPKSEGSVSSAPSTDTIATVGNSPTPPAPKPVATLPTTPAPKTVTTPTPTPAPAPQPKGMYNDGTYTGPSTDAYYGYMQVQAVIQGGKLVDVIFLDYPQDRNTSRYINGQAMPYLKQEALQAQSAQVDIISGATASSEAFQQSLGAALAQAKA